VEFDEAVAELEVLVGQLTHDRDERALRALELVDVIHRSALELIAAGEVGHRIAQAVLAMYDLVPLDEAVVVEEALDEIRAAISAHGCDLQLLEASSGAVRVRLSGARSADAAWASQVKTAVARALEDRYSAFARLTFESAAASATLVPIAMNGSPQASHRGAPAGGIPLREEGRPAGLEPQQASVGGDDRRDAPTKRVGP